MNKWLDSSLEWWFPRCCVLCAGDTRGLDLCPFCLSALPIIERGCERCGIPVTSGRLCGGCLQRPPPFERACIPYRYEPPLSSLLLRLKFRHRIETARPLGAILLDRVRRLPGPVPEVIVPVPLHPARLRLRGFNQSLEIARPLAEGLRLPLLPGLLRRFRETAAQSSLNDPAARRRNVRGAFEVDGRMSNGARHVAIVDDVVTTGTTAAEIARTLKRAGLSRVDLWSVARATVD